MHSKKLTLTLLSSLFSLTAWAEPPIQPGDTLESLSKVKISTSIQGQSTPSDVPNDGTDLLSNPVSTEQSTLPSAPIAVPTDPQQTLPSSALRPSAADEIPEAGKLKELASSAEQPVNLAEDPEQQDPGAATSHLKNVAPAQP